AGAFVFGADIEHAVSINIKVNFDLRNTARCRWNTVKVEASQRSVVLRFGTSALQHVNFYAGLIGSRRRKGFRLAGRNSRISFDQLSRNAAERFDSKAQGRNVEQYHIINVAAHDSTLNSSS